MEETRVLAKIMDWFGYEPFMTSDLTDQMVQELVILILEEHRTNDGRRTVIGRNLARLDGFRFSTREGSLAVFVARETPKGQRRGPYRIMPVRDS